MADFTRNKLISVYQDDDGSLKVHGVLEDDIYGLEVDVVFSSSSLSIQEIAGKWNRLTTPECHRALPALQQAVGLSAAEDGFSAVVRKTIGRESCRHFANLLIECGHSARAAIETIPRDSSQSRQWVLQAKTQTAEKSTAPQRVSVSPPQDVSPCRKHRKKEANRHGTDTIIDLHTHTMPASPCSAIPVSALIKEAAAMGLDGICLTDHHHVWPNEEIDLLCQTHGFLVLAGNEITTDEGDILVFGATIPGSDIMDIETLGKQVRQQGGFMIAAHPFRGFLTFGVERLGLTPEAASRRRIFQHADAVETRNGQVAETENRFAEAVAGLLNLPQTGGSDAHGVGVVGRWATSFSARIQNEKDLISALKSSRYRPVAFRQQKG